MTFLPGRAHGMENAARGGRQLPPRLASVLAKQMIAGGEVCSIGFVRVNSKASQYSWANKFVYNSRYGTNRNAFPLLVTHQGTCYQRLRFPDLSIRVQNADD